MKTVSNWTGIGNRSVNMDQSSLEKRVFHALRRHGYKLTRQRRAVVEALSTSTCRLTPAELYARVHAMAPDVGLVTVYRTLRLLLDLDLICEISIDGRQPTYLLRRPTEHHHHIVCTSCGRVVDFTSDAIEMLARQLASETGYLVRSHVLEFSGTCPACRKRISS